MKARTNSKINNYRNNIKRRNKHRIKMQRSNFIEREDAMGYCLAHYIYLNWHYVGNVKKGKCIECKNFIKIHNKKGEKL